MDKAFRDQFRALIEQNRAFVAAVSKLDHEKIKKVMTPESFADPLLGADVLKELDGYVLLEQEHGVKADQSLASLRHTFETADWTAANRQNALNSFDLILAAPMALRHTYLQELNKRIRLSNSLREEMLKAQQAYKDEQNKRLKTVGIDPGSVGSQ